MAAQEFFLPDPSGERLVNVCGVSNRAGAGLAVCKWPMNLVRVCVQGGLPGVDHDSFLAIFRKAVSLWTDAAQLDVEFIEDASRGHLVAKAGRPGRLDQFDGPGGVLAWCELPCGNTSPQTQLQMRFDPAEAWTDSELLFLTIVHEIGHGWGLPHSEFPGNIMQPFLNLSLRALGSHDFSQIIGRYGRRQTPPPVTPVPPTVPVPPSVPEGTLVLNGKRYHIIQAS